MCYYGEENLKVVFSVRCFIAVLALRKGCDVFWPARISPALKWITSDGPMMLR